jgi:hypothetical protein
MLYPIHSPIEVKKECLMTSGPGILCYECSFCWQPFRPVPEI